MDIQLTKEIENNPDILIRLPEFITKITPRFKQPTHLKPITDLLDGVAIFNNSIKAIISVPPQHWKTETILHFIAKYLSLRPHKTVAYFSYSHMQASSKTLIAQRYSKIAGVIPDPQRQNIHEWRTIEGGGILTVGIDGGGTGQHVDLLIIDDPIANREMANSIIQRQKLWSWFTDVVETRATKNLILIMTRWHEDDLAGRIIKSRPEYKTLRLSALADGLDADGRDEMPDMLGRQVGDALLPDDPILNKHNLELIKERNPYTFTELYQGLPRIREDMLFKIPTFYRELPSELRYSVGVDVAYTEKTRADWTAYVLMGEKDNKWYIIDVKRWQKDITVTKEMLLNLQKRFAFRFSVEANGVQKAVADILSDSGLSIKRILPKGDKYTRSLEMAEAWNTGNLMLPDPTIYPEKIWLQDYISEFEIFSGINDLHDDQVDATTMAFNELKMGEYKAYIF